MAGDGSVSSGDGGGTMEVSDPPLETGSSVDPRAPPRPRGLSKCQVGAVSVAFAVMFLVLVLPLGFGPDEYKTQQPAQRCLAMVAFVAILWGSDAVPAYLTSLCVPLVAVLLRVMCVPRSLRLSSETDTLLVPASYCNSTDPLPGHPMNAQQAVIVSTGSFFNPVILLFLCGFVISTVLNKYHISQRVAAVVLKVAGQGPGRRMVFIMALCVVMSAILSNVPAAVVTVSLLVPSFDLNEAGSWPQFSLLGTAFACNVGAMITPIASPQNVVAVIALSTATQGAVTLGFADWLLVALPFCVITNALIWVVLRIYYRKGLPATLVTAAEVQTGIQLATLKVSTPSSVGSREALLDGASDHEGAGSDSLGDSGASASGSGAGAGAGAGREPAVPTAVAAQQPSPGGMNSGAAGLRKGKRHGTSRGSAEYGLLDDEHSKPSSSGGNGRQCSASLSLHDIVIGSTVAITVLVWVGFGLVESVFGNIGLVALFPILVFGAMGYLSREDFNGLSWDTLMLLGGGLSLGTAVDSSGLLITVGDVMDYFLHDSSPFVVLLAFTALLSIVATYISSTVSSVLLMPVVATVGLRTGHPRMMVLLCSFMISGAMGSPVSSFPNAYCNSITRKHYRPNAARAAPVLTNTDYVRNGVPITLLIFLACNTFGFGLCELVGF